jgi:hypothetical protein
MAVKAKKYPALATKKYPALATSFEFESPWDKGALWDDVAPAYDLSQPTPSVTVHDAVWLCWNARAGEADNGTVNGLAGLAC